MKLLGHGRPSLTFGSTLQVEGAGFHSLFCEFNFIIAY